MTCLRGKKDAAHLKVLAIQALDTADRAEGKCEAIAAWPSTMGLARKSRRCRGARGMRKTRSRGGKADVGFGEMQPSSIMPAAVVVFAAMSNVRWWDGKLGGDLKQGRLGARETELALKERGFGGVSIGVRQVQALHGINQLLGG